MATVNLGLIKFRWQGAYAGGTAYVKDDVVSYNGSSYVCILASTGNLPTNTTYWNVMAQGGTDITSLAGLAQGDILYYNGSDWVRLGAGTSGQFLKTLGTGANPNWGDVTSAIRKISMFNDATYNVSTPNASVAFPITFDFVKAQADSDLFVFGWTPVSAQNSYLGGVRMRIQKTADSSYDSPTDGEAYGGNLFMSPPAGSSSDQAHGAVNWSRRVDTSSETFFNSAETYRIHLGWSSRDGSAQRLGDTWNPQNSSNRMRQFTTNIWVWELDPSTTAFIT